MLGLRNSREVDGGVVAVVVFYQLPFPSPTHSHASKLRDPDLAKYYVLL